MTARTQGLSRTLAVCACAATVLLFTLRGTPTNSYGDKLVMRACMTSPFGKSGLAPSEIALEGVVECREVRTIAPQDRSHFSLGRTREREEQVMALNDFPPPFARDGSRMLECGLRVGIHRQRLSSRVPLHATLGRLQT